MKPQKCMNSNSACSVSSSTALSLCASQTKFSAKCGGDKMFNQAKKNNSSDNFVLSSFPSKYANRFWRGFQNWVVDLWLKRTRFKENIYYFEIEKCRADRYWVLFCKIKWLKNCSYQKILTGKLHWKNQVNFL